jgi:hypothetical protein
MSRKFFRNSSREKKKSRIKPPASARQPDRGWARLCGSRRLLSPTPTRPTSPALKPAARGSSALARSSPQPAPKSTSASMSAPRPSR